MLGAATETKKSKLELSVETQALLDRARAGDARAQYTVGCYYYWGLGQGLPINEKEAFQWFQRAAAQNYALAICRLGICYGYGVGVEKNIGKAVELCRQSLAQLIATELIAKTNEGNTDAQASMGTCYDNGWGVKEDKTQAVIWYCQAAKQGHAQAQFSLGCYMDGRGMEKGAKQAAEWYRQAAAQGHADAQFNLGNCYANGQGVEQDAKQAVDWYRQAATQGYAKAQFNLGICYDAGQGVEQDAKQALGWYRQAAVQGHAKAQFNLGVCYATGQGVVQDMQQAVAWYHKAAAQGDAQAQYNLGVHYATGQGVVQENAKQAVEWYRQAAMQGHAKAQFNLGICYANGQGVEQDAKQAADWYQKAAAQGLAQAQCNLGVCYATGQGVKPDAKQAVDWFRQVAKQGSSRAAYLLGLCYASDWGIEKEEKNKEKAIQWFQKTAELGFTGNTAEGLTSTGMFSQQASHQDLQWQAYLGAGNFGVVFQGLRQSVPVAIKQLKMEYVTDNEILKAFKADCEMIPRLPRVPNVVQYLHCALTYPGQLVMEYAPNGSLHDRLHGRRSHQSKPLLSWDNRYRLMTDIVRGLAHLHNAGILHCDLRSANVLLSGMEEKDNKNSEAKEVADEKLVAKVSDFGLAKTKEQISRQASSKSGITFTKETDIYSLGTTLWEMVSGKEPTGRQHPREEIPKDCPPKLASLIRFCWETEPAKRPQAAEALKFLEQPKEKDYARFAAS